jgi:hypothetical protein
MITGTHKLGIGSLLATALGFPFLLRAHIKQNDSIGITTKN